MTEFRVVHVADFHLECVDGEEHLRTGYYQEYLGDLSERILAQGGPSVDAIVATGDFVHKGATSNFEHAQTVLQFLAKSLDVPQARVYTCIGNHDFDRAIEARDGEEEARKPYLDFASSFGDAHLENISPRARLGPMFDDAWFLSLDSTFGAKGQDCAAPMADSEIDEIVNAVREQVGPRASLVIASHHPPEIVLGRTAPFADSSSGWVSRHIWWHASYISRRISSSRRDAFNVWLSGDIHYGVQFVERGFAFACCGRLGTRVGLSHGETRRQATLLDVDVGEHSLTGIGFEYVSLGSSKQAHAGEWSATPLRVTHVEERDEGKERSRRATEKLEVIDTELQERLLESIRSKSCYHFGRYDTGGDLVSLAWVTVGPLLTDGNNLAAVLGRMADWTRTRVLDERHMSPDQTVLVGTDCWGAVFASQVSVMTGAKNYCVAVRGDGAHSTPEEVIAPALAKAVMSCSAIILITDVVASGVSLARVRKQLLEAAELTPEQDKAEWYALSILCDLQQDHRGQCDFLTVHGTLCGDLRMPVISRDQLPSERILPSILTFT